MTITQLRNACKSLKSKGYWIKGYTRMNKAELTHLLDVVRLALTRGGCNDWLALSNESRIVVSEEMCCPVGSPC